MKFMGWGPAEYDACSLSLRDEIVSVMREHIERAQVS